MARIEIGRLGRIIAGKNQGEYVKVEDDSNGGTGGFYVLTSGDKTPALCFDDWVADRAGLEGYFRESGWEVEWE